MTGSAPSAAPPADSAERVSTLELFFDLVFVFTITQLSTLLVDEPTWKGVVQAVFMLGVIWWMYDGYAWLTNAVPPDRASRRVFLLAAMAAFLVLALAIPGAFSGSGASFGIAYLAIVLIHAGLFASSTSQKITRAIFGLAPANVISALLILAGGIAGGTAQYVLWGLGFATEWATPFFIRSGGFLIAPAHFVERHGLVVIIAIGESVVAVGIGAGGLPVDLELIGVAVLGLLLSACLWWAYFGTGDADRAEAALSAAPAAERQTLSVTAFGYWHMPILFGVIAMAATLRHAIGHPSDDLTTEQALLLGGGAALFLVGDVFYRRTLGLGRGPWRLVAALLALATVPLGTGASAVAQLGALAAVLTGAFAAEQATESQPRYLSGRSG
ncbi:MAG TPA: low temperature requirement protein A [Thermoleophilaceae bacterium]